MKTCGKCGEAKPLTSYTKNRSKKDGLCSSCKDCHREYTRKHYKENKAYYVGKARRANDQRRDEIRKLLRDRKKVRCADCKRRFPFYAMDFDHVRGRKCFELAHALQRSFKIPDVLKELDKCDVVCAVCHRIRTHERNNPASPNG